MSDNQEIMSHYDVCQLRITRENMVFSVGRIGWDFFETWDPGEIHLNTEKKISTKGMNRDKDTQMGSETNIKKLGLTVFDIIM